ncbi:MAG: hypothetical protein L0211_13545 [Planctomycetaceae bacterium]|nr:hypothetical protein [Planctomycetaceae bacterium]
MPRSARSTAGSIALVFLCGLAIGCGGNSGGRVSGKVTFKGQPVPAGKVYITPDSSQGNSGQTGFADIKDGAYDTAAPGGQGAVTGPVVIKVDGTSPTPPPGAAPDVTSTLLFSGYELKAELSGSATVQDIDVPADVAKGSPQQPARAVVVP